jgi:serine/threonine-protein kinase RsbT
MKANATAAMPKVILPPKSLQIIQESPPLAYAAEVKAFARLLGFNEKTVSEICIVVCELVSNVQKFARSGTLRIGMLNDSPQGIELIVDDVGPGIPNIELAIQDGFSEGDYIQEMDFIHQRKGLGCGLGAVKRLMNTLTIENKPEGGTRIVTRKYIS